MNDLAHRLKTEREAKGWSQPELAKRSHVKQSFIGALEARNQGSSSWLPEIAHALGVDAYWLKTGRGEKSSATNQSQEEQMIIDAYRLFDSDKKDDWMYAAKKKLAEHEASKSKAA